MRRRRWMGAAILFALLVASTAVSTAVAAGELADVSDAGSWRVSPLAGPELRISGKNADSGRYAAAASNSTGGQYLVVWRDQRNYAVWGDDIFGQLVAADGTRVGFNFQVTDRDAGRDQTAPAVAYSPSANQYLVVWQDARNSGVRGDDIYGQRVAADGTLVGSNFRISGKKATGNEWGAEIAYDTVANRYMVVWSDDRRNSGSWEIFAQRVAANGTKVGSNIRVSGKNASGDQAAPVVAFGPAAKQFMVVWQDARNQALRGTDVYGQRIASDGSRIGFNFRISGKNATSHECCASIADNPADNQFLVVWEDNRHSGIRGEDIYGQRIASDGSRIGFNSRISGRNATSDEAFPAVIHNTASSQYLVVWQDARNAGVRGVDIFGQRVGANGTQILANFRISGKKATGDEHWAAAAANPDGSESLVVWHDYRDTYPRGTRIYGQRVAG